MRNESLHVNITACNASEFSIINRLIAEFRLDDNDLRAKQFLVAKFEEKIVGFGRLRQYATCTELCSLGVVEDLRLRGIGRELTLALKKKTASPLYLVCIIPDFFSKLGFTETHDFPSEIGIKLKYCTEALSVPETYVVMRRI